MSCFKTVLAIAFLLVCESIFTQPASAQATYAAQRPFISPWMGLWQKNTGPVDNYHSFVLPQMQLDQTLQLQNAALNRQAQGLQNLNSEVTQAKWDQSSIMPTGQGATFLNYSHYYGSNRPTMPVAPPRPTAAKQVPRIPTVRGMLQ